MEPDTSVLADSIAREIGARSVLQVECGDGSLVSALRNRGIDAHGLVSRETALDSVRHEVRSFCRAGSVTDGLERDYDLIVCLKALDHLSVADATRAIERMCSHSNDILFASLPSGGHGTQPVYVHPPEWWAERFAGHGFYRDVDYDATFVSIQAARLRRTTDPVARVIGGFERLIVDSLAQVHERNETVVEQEQLIRAQRAELDRLRCELAEARVEVDRQLEPLRAQIAELVAGLSQTESIVVEAQFRRSELERAVEEMAGAQDTATYRAARVIGNAVRRALPVGTRRGRLVTTTVHGMVLLGEQGPRAAARRLSQRIRSRALTTPHLGSEMQRAVPADDAAQREYERWLEGSRPTSEELAHMRIADRELAYRPLVSVIMPVYNAEEDWLREAILSVREQSYENWELCIADDCSPDDNVRRVLIAEADDDSRIKVVFRERNGGISEASNSALAMATGEWVGLLDHDDLLQPHALHRMVEYVTAHADVDLVYSDEDKLLTDGRRGMPFFKPDWSPELLTTNNYMCHFTMIRATVLHDVGGFRMGFDGSQDHELFLRVTDGGRKVGHVPDILYTWRMLPGSSALSVDAKPRATAARRAAIEEALKRRGAPARVENGRWPGWFDVRYSLEDTPTVSVIIPTRDRVDLLRRCIESIYRVSSYPHLRVVVVDNDSRDPATLEFLRNPGLTVIPHPGNFNYAAILNHAVRDLDAAPGEHLLFLNNDMEVVVPDWIEAMLEHSQRPEVGAVGCRLVYPDGRPQHEGVGLGIGGTANNLDLSSYFGLGFAVRDVSAVTGAAMMMRRSTFEEVGGFDEGLRIAFNDIDLCMRLRRAGYRVVYTPLAEVIHDESASRGRMHPLEDEAHFAARWGSGDALLDPFLNPNIDWYSPLRLRVRGRRPSGT
jgi:GT2 family glycosyltransferase